MQVWRPDADDASLVAYYTMSSIAEPDAMELHSHLRTRLPSHMVPLHIIHLNRMPLTENGKIDRNALPAPEFETAELSDPAALPRTELERLIGEIWSKALGCGRVGRGSNFFELGGNSLMALRVVKEINRVTDQELPLAAFFENPTLEKVAANLGTGADISYSVVPLNEFGRDPGATEMPPPPLFCISGIYIYQPMARLLEETCQVYGIYVQAEVDNFEQALRDGPSEEVTEALAAEYVAAIRSENPKGPYRLAGLSYGGIIAYEAAQQLIAQGETVDLVVMFDSIIPAHGWQRLSKRLARHRRRVLREGPGYLVDKIAGRLRKRVSPETAAMNGAVPDEQAMIDEEYDRRHARLMQLVRYQPQTFPGRIVFIQAVEFSEMRGFDASPQEGWSKYAQGGIKVFKAPGDHISIMQSESVSLWAGHLRDELKG